MTVGALPHLAAGRPAGITGMAARLLAVAVRRARSSVRWPTSAPSTGDWGSRCAVMAILLVAGLAGRVP